MTEPFDAVNASFVALARAGRLDVDGALLHARLAGRRLDLVTVRRMFLHSRVTPPGHTADATDEPDAQPLGLADFEGGDPLLRELVARARAQPEPWKTGLAGMLLPGLARVRSTILRFNPALRTDPTASEDLQAELLAGLLDTARSLPPGTTQIARELLRGAATHARRYARAYTADVEATNPGDPDDPTLPEPATGRAGEAPTDSRGPEDVLADAVAEKIITAEDAELIAETRLGGVSLADLAERTGIPYDVLRKRRQRAEALIAAWLRQPHRNLARGHGGRPRRE